MTTFVLTSDQMGTLTVCLLGLGVAAVVALCLDEKKHRIR